jgi:hypothetical protein
MTVYKVSTPVPDHTGPVGGVDFVKGSALVDDVTHAAELGYFRGAGYVVDEYVPPAPEPPAEVGDDDDDPTTPPPGNASEDAWRAHCLAIGATEDQVAGLKRDQLKELAATIQEGPKE